MTVDHQLRQQYMQEKNQKQLVTGVFQSMADAMNLHEQQKQLIETLSIQEKQTSTLLDKLGSALVLIHRAIPKVVLPKVFQVKGNVTVDNSLAVQNFKELAPYFASLDKRISQLASAIGMANSISKVEITKPIEIENLSDLASYFQHLGTQIQGLQAALLYQPTKGKNENISVFNELIIELKKLSKKQVVETHIDLIPVIDAISSLKESFLQPTTQDNTKSQHLLRQIAEGIGDLASRPVYRPQPVTNITLNGLQGFVKTTDNTVGTTVTKLPSYGQLFDRRAIIVYNNSSNTIYVGGSDVTVATGLPVPASSYSPIIDAGYNMIFYGIASQNGNDVRCLEVSRDTVGSSIQE